jgi:hypothetical protein
MGGPRKWTLEWSGAGWFVWTGGTTGREPIFPSTRVGERVQVVEDRGDEPRCDECGEPKGDHPGGVECFSFFGGRVRGLKREVARLRAWLRLVQATTDPDSGYYALHGYDGPDDEFIESRRRHPEHSRPSAAGAEAPEGRSWPFWACPVCGDHSECEPGTPCEVCVDNGTVPPGIIERITVFESPSPSDRGDLGAVREVVEEIRRVAHQGVGDEWLIGRKKLIDWIDRLDSAAPASPAREETRDTEAWKRVFESFPSTECSTCSRGYADVLGGTHCECGGDIRFVAFTERVARADRVLLGADCPAREPTEEEPVCGVNLIAEERRRQITGEGWTPEHDDAHDDGEMAMAASSYLLPPDARPTWLDLSDTPEDWPWAKAWWKPSPDDRVRELVKAGALVAAEIDRLLRSASRGGGNDR